MKQQKQFWGHGFLVALAWVLLFPGMAPAEELVKAVEFKGLQKVSEEELRAVVQTKPGEPLNRAQVTEDQTRLFTLGYFQKLGWDEQSVEDGVNVVFYLEEAPQVSEVTIVGNRQITAEEIRKAVGVQQGDFFPPGKEFDIQRTLKGLYEGRKLFLTEVNVQTAELPEHKVRVDVSIDEKKRIIIKDLRFQGNQSFSSWRLRLLCESRGSWFFFKNDFSDEAFEEDLLRVRDFYQAHGFLDVEVTRGKFIYREEKGWVIPIIAIEEGPRYQVRNIIPRGYTLFTREEIMALFVGLEGKPYRQSALYKGIRKLSDLYGDEAFLLMKCDPEFTREPKTRQMDIVLNIQEGPRVYVGDVQVQSESMKVGPPGGWLDRWYRKLSPPVKDEVIRREVRLTPGEPYRRFEEVRTIERLRRLQIFEEVEVERMPTEEKDVFNSLIKVREGVTGNVLVGVGYGDATGVFVEGRYVERSLFGEAKDLEIGLLIGSRRQDFRISYYDRYFRGGEQSLRATIYRTLHTYHSYDELQTGAAVEMGHPFNEYLKGYLRLRGAYAEFDDIDDDVEEDLDDYPIVAVRGLLAFDKRDDLWYPTRGWYGTAGVEVGHADEPLVKFTASYERYWKIYKQVVYALSLRLGFLLDEDVGITERFFMGGSDDLRGFEYRGAGPRDAGDDDMAIGGATKFLVQNELRYPIFKDLKGLVFLDAGMLDRDTFSWGDLRMSTGTGFRLRFPVFYLSLDFAVPLIEEDEDETQYVHFKLGPTF